MALFDKPYRYIPQAEPVDALSGADVAVVDVAARDEPELMVPVELGVPEQKADTAVQTLEIAPSSPDAPATQKDAQAKDDDVPATPEERPAKEDDAPAKHEEEHPLVVEVAAAPAPAPEPPAAVKPVELASTAPDAEAEGAAQPKQAIPAKPEALPTVETVVPQQQPAASEPTVAVGQPAAVDPAPSPSLVVASGAHTPIASVELAPSGERGLRPAVEGTGLVVFSRAVAPEAYPASQRGDSQRLINSIDESEPVLDQLRSLAASLHQARTGRELKVIAVTSSVSGEGKTLLAANLALTLSRSYMRQVLLIDADLRRPGLHRLFGVPSQDGIRSALESVRGGLPVSIQEVAPRLALLPAGKPVRDPISSLASDAMQQMVGAAASTFDWVILDTPPVGMLPDVGLLSSLSDAVLLVVEAGRVRYDLVQRTVESIGADRIFGVVLNKVPEQEIVATYGMHYYAPYR